MSAYSFSLRQPTLVKVSGDFFGATATLTQTQRRVSGSVGYSLIASNDATVVPFASVELVWFDGSVRGENVNFAVPEDTYTPLSFGVGIVMHDRFGLNTAFNVPVGISGGQNSLVTSLSIALGGR